MAIDPITAGLDLANSIINKIWPDETEEKKANAENIRLQIVSAFQLVAAQIQTNIEEAKSTSLFVAGWRPAIGWCCALALGYQYLVRPMLSWTMAVIGHPIPPMPGLDDNLWELMLGMLGIGGLRTFEKVRKVD